MGRKKESLPDRFWKHVRRTDGCWEWAASRIAGPGRHPGYGRFQVDGRNVPAHRFSWELHHGPIPAGVFILHHCDNPPCVRPDHLFLGNHRVNAQDAWSKGRARSNLPADRAGEANGNARLTDEQIMEIRRRYAGGERQVGLATEFGVTQPYVSKVVRRVNRVSPPRGPLSKPNSPEGTPPRG